MLLCFFFFKQKTAYEMRISDCSSDVCSSDLVLITTTDPGMARPAKTAVQLRPMRTTSKLGGAVGTVPAAGAGVGGGTGGGASILACGGMPRLLLSAPKKITARIPTTATPRRMKKKRLHRTRPAPASQTVNRDGA